jgi:nucleotide-binding universal stress UspA family protein
MQQRLSQRRRIVVGVDGSSSSKRALRWAVDFAELTTATVDAVIVCPNQPVSDYGYGWMPVAATDEALADAAADAVLMTSIAEVLGDGPHAVPVRPRILHGRPTDVLLLAARSADMLIVGSRGHGTVAGILLDSVSQHCVQHAPCPVLVIPAAPVTSPLDLFSPRRRGRRAIPDLLATRTAGDRESGNQHHGRRRP